jgi:hypothetical protein
MIEIITADELWDRFNIRVERFHATGSTDGWHAFRVGCEAHFYYLHNKARFEYMGITRGTLFPSESLLRQALDVFFKLNKINTWEEVWAHRKKMYEKELEESRRR